MASGGGMLLQELVISLGVKADWSDMNKVLSYLNSSTVKTAALGKGLVNAGKAMYNFIKTNVQAEQSFASLARTQNKSLETVRAEQNALKAMGKTMSEVSKDPALKTIYNDIVKVNKSLALPDMKGAMAMISQLQGAFYQLKSVISYATQWINYHILANLQEPIQRITDYLKKISDFIRNDINGFSSKIASYMTAFSKGLLGIVELGVKIVEWVEKLPSGIKAASTAIVGVFALLKSGPLGQLLAVITAVGGLIDDYENYQWNKNAPEGEKVDVAFGGIWEVLDADDKSISEKATEIGSLLVGKISESVEGNGVVLGALGGTLISSVFGSDALSKIVLFLASAFAIALVDPSVQSAVLEFAKYLWQCVIDAMPEWARNFFGLEDTTHKEARESIDEPLRFDEGGYAVTEWEYQNSNPERKARIDNYTPTESDLEFQAAYRRLTGASGAELYQAPGDLYPTLAAPSGTKFNASNTPAMQQWSELFQQAMLNKDPQMIDTLNQVGKTWQTNVTQEGVTKIGQEMYNDIFSHQLSEISTLSKAGLPYLGSDYDLMKSGIFDPTNKYTRQTNEWNLQALVKNRNNNLNTSGFQQSLSDALSGTVPLETGKITVPSDAGSTIIKDVQSQIDSGSKKVKVSVEGKNDITTKNAWGGRYNHPITTEVAEDGGTEYIIPLNKPARAFSLIKQMFSEMGGVATNQLMKDLGLGVEGTVGSSAASISAMAGGSNISNSYNISAPVTIQVTASGSDAKAIGTAAYSAAERQLIRSLKGVLA